MVCRDTYGSLPPSLTRNQTASPSISRGHSQFGHLCHCVRLPAAAPDEGREVDLALLNHADPLFLKKILERCRLLFGSPQALAELRLHAFRRHQDHRWFLALERPYVRRVLGRMAGR